MKLYVVQNARGQYFRPRGQGGYAEQWYDQLEKAKFYPKIGTAKAQCVTWYNYNKKLGCPNVLEFDLDPSKAVTINMLDHALKSAEKKAKKEEKREMERKAYLAVQGVDKTKLLKMLTPEQKAQLGI